MPAVMKIFAGPPGTGKTYRVAREAVRILRPDVRDSDVQRVHRELVEQGLICWVTFHPSYSYEDFVEGFRPEESEDGNITYSVLPGPFLRACRTASAPVGPSRFHVGERLGRYTVENVEPGGVVLSSTVSRADAITESGRGFVDFWTLRLFRDNNLDVADMRISGANNARKQEVARITRLPTTFFANSSRHAAVYEHLQSDPAPTPVVLVIDEINRADLSRVFGELITLLEFDKREGGSDEKSVVLAYSGTPLTVPANLSILGTMNTADKSLSTVDLALRRRFEFIFVPPDATLVPEHYGLAPVRALFMALNRRISSLNGSENLIGHADFIQGKLDELREREGYAASDEGRLKAVAHVIRMKTVPFLVDLFRGDWSSVRFVAGEHLLVEEDISNLHAELEAMGITEPPSNWRMADWWDPRGSEVWDAARFQEALSAIARQIAA